MDAKKRPLVPIKLSLSRNHPLIPGNVYTQDAHLEHCGGNGASRRNESVFCSWGGGGVTTFGQGIIIYHTERE